jgi:hypothetical protein
MHQFRIALLIGSTLVSGCGFPGPLSSEDREALDSCNTDVNRAWDVQHRDQLSIRTDRDAPYSGNTPPGLPSDNLSDEYAHNSMINRCLHESAIEPSTSTTTDRAGSAPAAPPSHP